MSILKAFQVACVAVVAYKVATGSYRFGKFMGSVAGQIETLKAAGYSDEHISTLTEEQFKATVASVEKAA